jgi:hypothetical protein
MTVAVDDRIQLSDVITARSTGKKIEGDGV